MIWQCNHKFQSNERCSTPHLYEDEIKQKFVEVCGRVAVNKNDFISSCRQIVVLLSNCTALDRKIEEQYIHLNGLAAAMQQFIRKNAMRPQDSDFYSKRMAEYETKKSEGEARLKELQSKKAARLSRKELLEGLIRTLDESEMSITQFDEKLWRLMVEKVVVGTDSKLTFTLRNGMEIEV